MNRILNRSGLTLNISPSFNIAPSQLSPVVLESSNQLSLTEMKWGLIPAWAKDASMGNKLINARSETLHEKPSFRDSFKNKRCLIPTDGFIEWKDKKASFYQDEKPAIVCICGLVVFLGFRE